MVIVSAPAFTALKIGKDWIQRNSTKYSTL